ncbi:hypothetical protein EXIGLDRAFT_749364 [Exidia glandulosa HHB12029]|uniref:Signal peptidase complex subunit 2 n=1 Tax=Exidia glandulosa HHB12029 TaxID=1314781 RepID=A0A166AL68_EXIGL|nr:hypothetical protein EXIGLDRAFT_749364 [Exidia glandulosa HHB12029]
MARKKTGNDARDPSPLPADDAHLSPSSSSAALSQQTKPAPIPLILAPEGNAGRDAVKVNNASANEMKIACDDAVKRFLAQPGAFNTIHMHTDVRLLLGWGAVIVAALTGLYGWKMEFEKAKPVVTAGVVLYMILSSAQTLYAYFIEQNIVFEGKRKTLQRRKYAQIETERITLSSKTLPSTPSTPPKYEVSVSYVHSTNGGKLLLGRARERAEMPYTAFFDAAGTMDQDRFDAWLHELVGRAMGSGAGDAKTQ